jgi:hypothetical protein
MPVAWVLELEPNGNPAETQTPLTPQLPRMSQLGGLACPVSPECRQPQKVGLEPLLGFLVRSLRAP